MDKHNKERQYGLYYGIYRKIYIQQRTIVPHHMYTELCEECFLEEYGEIIDFIYAYEGESGWFDKVIWLPEHLAEVQ